MKDELQVLVEAIAHQTGAPTVLEDANQTTVVHGPQGDHIDEIRRLSILRRETSPEVVAWFEQFGIGESPEPLRTPARPDLGILGRLCIPVRYQDQLMGYLWLIDDEEALDPATVARVRQTAEPIGLLMYHEVLVARMESDVLAHLLSPSEGLRQLAAREILDNGMLPKGPCAVVVVQVAGLD
ncbi:MAG: PucR family transcriptional regulator, partial [Acidimicrobiales bacterium]